MAVKLNQSEQVLLETLQKTGADKLAADFAKVGLPTRRNEAYHYSDLKMLLGDVPALTTGAISTSALLLNIEGAYRILIVNGEVQISDEPPAGMVVSTSKGGVVEPENDIIAKLNSALTKETLNIDLQGSLETIIHIDRRYEGEASHINDGVELYILDNSNATIIETFSGSNEAHLSNSASKVILGKDAKVTHIMVDLSGDRVRHLQSVQYELNESALLHSLIIHKGSALARTQLFAKFIGENAHADFAGLILGNNEQHSDISINIEHNVANTTSSENYKSVVLDRAKAIFQGKILVAKDAQKTDAAMKHQGLMLSDDAQILVKPELEIYADDVICGHGATCGQIDEDSLFYLMSRGIEREQAKSMLIRAFLAELFDEVKIEALKEALISVADEWLEA
ncbi:MAG: Fe-S cluster assembly protein SufD [Devosiaceae bacterium]|nr:Fe-S cluster assembly protein SufD [Devosiaceae bacterium]